MGFRTSKSVIALRNFTRKLGINRLLMRVFGSSTYEDKFNQVLLASVRPGDLVWDVGANIGHYTQIFAGLAGEQGKVFAFEPSPVNFAKLSSNTAHLGNVSLLNCGLGDQEGRLSFQQGEDEIGATSRVVASGAGGTEVEVRRGDEVVAAGTAAVPQFIKIDVEGFEWEVLQGLGQILKNPALRALGIEVHFGLLAERGMADVPNRIEQLLQSVGFSCQWPDSSHILATRSA